MRQLKSRRDEWLTSPLRLGFAIGLVFGSVNVLVTWLAPLADDSPAALLGFYGPMFLSWGCVAFLAARRTGRLLSGMTAGIVVAFATFCIYHFLVLLRVNVFLNELIPRADWQNMVMRFRTSGVDSFRLFVNVDYVRGAPLKISVASLTGSVIGLIGGTLGRLTRRRTLFRDAQTRVLLPETFRNE